MADDTPIYTQVRRELGIPKALWQWHFDNADHSARAAVNARARRELMLKVIPDRDAIIELGGYCCGGGGNPGGHEWNCKVYKEIR